jgi:hypothetical protein
MTRAYGVEYIARRPLAFPGGPNSTRVGEPPGGLPQVDESERVAGGTAKGGPVRDEGEVSDRHLAATASPARYPGVQRRPHHPSRRGRMSADRRPRRPRPGEGLGNKVLRGVPVADTEQDGEQALILGSAVELREV